MRLRSVDVLTEGHTANPARSNTMQLSCRDAAAESARSMTAANWLELITGDSTRSGTVVLEIEFHVPTATR